MRLLLALVTALYLAPAAIADAPVILHDHFTYDEVIEGVRALPSVRHADETHTRMLE